jgi:hypothetical protein
VIVSERGCVPRGRNIERGGAMNETSVLFTDVMIIDGQAPSP